MEPFGSPWLPLDLYEIRLPPMQWIPMDPLAPNSFLRFCMDPYGSKCLPLAPDVKDAFGFFVLHLSPKLGTI